MPDNAYWFTFSLLSNFNKCIQVNTCGKNCEALRPQLHKIYAQVKEMSLAQHKKTHIQYLVLMENKVNHSIICKSKGIHRHFIQCNI